MKLIKDNDFVKYGQDRAPLTIEKVNNMKYYFLQGFRH